MANYIGNQPLHGEFKRLDSIESQFNGSTATFTLKYNTVTQSAGDASQLIVSLNGVVQEPLGAYTLGTGGSTLTFSTAPQSGDTCHIVMLGGVGATATPTDNSVTTAKIVDGAVTSSKISIDGDISFPDNDKLIFGAGSDLQIYHDGSNSYIKNNTGVMRIHGTEVQIKDEDNNETLAVFFPQGSVDLYYDNSKKLATTSTGIDVTGTTVTDGLTVNSGTTNTTATFQSTDAGAYINFTDTTGTSGIGNDTVHLYLDVDKDNVVADSQIRLRVDGSTKLTVKDSGNVGIGETSPDYRLEVKGTATTNTDIVGFSNSNGTVKHIFGLENVGAGRYSIRDASNNTAVFFSAHDADNSYVNAGKVGIGTTSPSRKLSVHSDDSATGGNVLLVRNANSTAGSFINFIAGGNNAPAIGAKGNDIVFTHDGYSGNELVRIREDGRVGINASSPDFKFNVVGSTNYETVKLYYTETANVTQRLGIAGRNYENNDNIGIIAMYDDGSNCVVNIGGSFTAPDNIEFRTGSASAVRMNVDPNGNLVVGNAGVSFASDRLQVESPSNEPAASFYRPRNTGGGGLVRFMSDVGGTQTIVAQVTSEGNFNLNGGINFGSTGGNVTSKTLDDYEEGTFTPTLVTVTGTPTYSYQSGKYTKVGNFVQCGGIIGISNSSSLSGTIRFTLPFNADTPAYGMAMGSTADGSGFTWPINGAYSIQLMSDGSNRIILIPVTTTPSALSYTTSGVANSWYFRFNVSYFAV